MKKEVQQQGQQQLERILSWFVSNVEEEEDSNTLSHETSWKTPSPVRARLRTSFSLHPITVRRLRRRRDRFSINKLIGQDEEEDEVILFRTKLKFWFRIMLTSLVLVKRRDVSVDLAGGWQIVRMI